MDSNGTAVGDGWTPSADKLAHLSYEDWSSECHVYEFCKNCFRRYSLPLSWVSQGVPDTINPQTPNLSDVSEAEEASNDTASEEEAIDPLASKHIDP